MWKFKDKCENCKQNLYPKQCKLVQITLNKNYIYNSEEKHRELKLDDSDRNLDNLQGGCPDDRDEASIFYEGIFCADTKGEI